ncbi:unnamed protein product [Cylindrotheca closterium]|uniref:4-hydroxyphenylpyruvate dioxygenase n=1 Tax=Cylindrotheca closterium TaxID=2856 RepID=A0AAD2CAE3_9STRA|nr:unnamed protein product [Cylindrotheca closterium]
MSLVVLLSILSLQVTAFVPTQTCCHTHKPLKFQLESTTNDVEISFSHLQLYTDHIGSVSEYKELEESLNSLSLYSSSKSLSEKRELWKSQNPSADPGEPFIPQNRDVVKQLLVGFGFRVTGCRLPEGKESTNTRSLLVTSRDPNGVQIVVTAADGDKDNSSDSYQHFDAENIHRFYEHQAHRQGIAVLGFDVNDASLVHQRYKEKHPNLIHAFNNYDDAQVLEVFAYYHHEGGSNDENRKADAGTLLRFIESKDSKDETTCKLPGLDRVDATFDESSQAAYCDHWVSNVISRTEFLSTLEDTLGFTPKVDFNAGVVAAGEAQIESTVTGNESLFRGADKAAVLRDQSQVYLPINNALSEVGHVHGFLEEIGQGIQHVASRVGNLVEFIQRCNDMREVTGEGFTFLNIPRSYYGIVDVAHLVECAGMSSTFAEATIALLENSGHVAPDGAVSLDVTEQSISEILDKELGEDDSYQVKKDEIIAAILESRYKNLYSLLGDGVSEETYLGIVRNKILCDVQGGDILYQIFTSNILQREPHEEAPFFEYIQRVCAETKSQDGLAIKPGCGGFGIRNFLTLFLSIEVSKAMLEVSDAKARGDQKAQDHAQQKVDCFTNQLNDSNPILTQISDAMTMEGYCKEQMAMGLAKGDKEASNSWKVKMEEAASEKAKGNKLLMECSARYQDLMRKLREEEVTMAS